MTDEFEHIDEEGFCDVNHLERRPVPPSVVYHPKMLALLEAAMETPGEWVRVRYYVDNDHCRKNARWIRNNHDDRGLRPSYIPDATDSQWDATSRTARGGGAWLWVCFAPGQPSAETVAAGASRAGRNGHAKSLSA